MAAVLRLAWLGSVPGPLSHDEAVKGYDAWSVLHTGRDQYGERFPLVFRAIGDYREAAMPYLIAVSEAVFGPTDFAVRLPAALAGVALVGATFLLGSELGGRRVGLAAAGILAVSPWGVQISRLAFRAGLVPLCVTVGLWLFLRAIRRGGTLVPAGAVLGLSLHTYLGARAFLPLLLLGITLVYRRELLARPRATLFGAAALALVAAPLLLWGLGNRADFFGHAGASAGWREAGGALPFVAQTARKYAAYLGPGNLMLHGDPYPVPSTGRFGVLYWPEVPLFLAGVVLLVRRHRPGDVLLMWWLLTFPLAPAFTEGSPPDWLRSSSGLPVFELIAALGLVHLAAVLAPHLRSYRPWLPRALSCALALGLALNVAWFLHDYALRFPNRAAWAFHDGMRSAVHEVAAREGGYERVVLPGRIPAIHDYYLFYARYDPSALRRGPLVDPAPPGAWADVRGWGDGRYQVCDPRLCCTTGSLCLVEGRDPDLPPPVAQVRDRTGRVAYTIVAGTSVHVSTER